MAEDRTVIVESPKSGGGSGWIIALVLIVALIAGVVFVTQMSGTQTAKDQAITNAADNVGAAAREVGSAARKAADNGGGSGK
jgi:flagellar basal body-associated protein FliL